MSATLKQKAPVTPTPFQSAERAALGAAISALADTDARKAALGMACATADDEVRQARRAVEATAEAIETAKANAARHLTDAALGRPGAAPQSIRQARAAAIEAADHLEACLAARDALKAEMAAGNDWSALRVQDAAVAVIKTEMRQRAIALAANVSRLQRELVARGSALEWLSRAGVLPPVERGADSDVRSTVQRMESAPNQWAIGTVRYATSFAQPIGAQQWQAAFEALKRDATAALPDED